jgi:C-terminal processing protease CtpA/Prc
VPLQPPGPIQKSSFWWTNYPDGRPTQRVGLIPDVRVAPTIAGIAAGRDEVLEEAVRQIEK